MYFRAWLAALRARLWDRQIERDKRAGKLDWLVDEAEVEHGAGQLRRLR